MGALPQAVGPPAVLNIQIPISTFVMKRRGSGAPPVAHLPLATGNKGKTAGLAVSRASPFFLKAPANFPGYVCNPWYSIFLHCLPF